MRRGRSSPWLVRWLCLTVVSGGVFMPAIAAGDPPVSPPAGAPPTGTPPAPTPPMGAVAAAAAAAAARNKLALLKDRVAVWCHARQELKGDCGNCGGTGAVRVGRFLKQCSVCLGAGKAISKVRFTQVNYEMISPD